MSPDLTRARDIARNKGLFGVFIVTASCVYAEQSHALMLKEETSPGIAKATRFPQLGIAFTDVHAALEANKRGEGSHEAVFEALARLAAEAGLLATEGDAGFPYDPAKVTP